MRHYKLTPALSDDVGVGDGVAEHESATERPIDAHPPHMHGSGADDPSGQ